MNHGLSAGTVAGIQDVLSRHPEIERAILYGSRAKGDYKTGSDIDLTLCGPDLTPALLASIADELDDLLLPYTIDLLILDRLDHPSLREHIERVGQEFYRRKQHFKALG